MELHLISFVFLLSCASSFGQYLGEIGCHTDARGTGCEDKKRCTVTCPSSCGGEGPAPTIWGTRIYSEDSPVCRSAIHDYRIPKDRSSKTNVTFIRSFLDPKKYLPSIQQGISSAVFGSFSGHFFFRSPYFTEDLLDVASLNFMSLYQRNGSFIQSCEIGWGVLIGVTFQFYLPSKAPKRIGFRTSSGGQEMLWSNPYLHPGGYWCNINNTYSDVMSLAMPADADFLPEEWTLTTSIQENVVIKLSRRQTTTNPMTTTWRKDQQILYSFPNIRQSQNESGYYLEIDKVDVGDAGIYSLEFSNKTETQGITRLIVRRCTKDHFGPSCEQKCPECENGGICHDITGNCICPPGFNGTNCENRCAEGYFGQMCSQSCTSSRHAKGSYCKGALICLPDPYGCSCAAGYKGLACDEEIGETTTTTIDSTTTFPTTVAITPTTNAPTTRPTTAATPTLGPTSIPITSKPTPSSTTATPTTSTTSRPTPSPTTVTPTTPTATTTITTTSIPTTTITAAIKVSDVTTASSTTRPTMYSTTITTSTTAINPTSISTVTTASTTRPTMPSTTTTSTTDITPTNISTVTTTDIIPTSFSPVTTTSTADTTTPTTSPTTDYSTTTASSTTSSSIMSPQERMCQTVMRNSRNFTVVPIPSKPCQYGCIEFGHKHVIPILKANGEHCKHGICVKGVCQETSDKTVCPEDFSGVRKSCQEYCYSREYPGMSILMHAKDGEFCIDENNYGLCINGKCTVLQRMWK